MKKRQGFLWEQLKDVQNVYNYSKGGSLVQALESHKLEPAESEGTNLLGTMLVWTMYSQLQSIHQRKWHKMLDIPMVSTGRLL